jgi:hypothetical protein
MFTDRHGNPTDDSDRECTGTMQEFGPGDDYDPMYDDAPGGSFKCGRGYYGTPCCLDEDNKFVGPGCRHCCPVDHECKPTGFGIEKFEDPAMDAANREMAKRRPQALYTTAGAYARTYWKQHRDGRMMMDDKGFPVMGVYVEAPAYAIDNETRDMIWRAWTTWSERLWKCSERIWDRLCDTCETHGEAVEKYTRWANRATKK